MTLDALAHQSSRLQALKLLQLFIDAIYELFGHHDEVQTHIGIRLLVLIDASLLKLVQKLEVYRLVVVES